MINALAPTCGHIVLVVWDKQGSMTCCIAGTGQARQIWRAQQISLLSGTAGISISHSSSPLYVIHM